MRELHLLGGSWNPVFKKKDSTMLVTSLSYHTFCYFIIMRSCKRSYSFALALVCMQYLACSFWHVTSLLSQITQDSSSKNAHIIIVRCPTMHIQSLLVTSLLHFFIMLIIIGLIIIGSASFPSSFIIVLAK